HGAETAASRTAPGPHIGFFRNWADPHPLFAKFRDPARQRTHAAAQMKYRGVPPHLLTKGFQQGFGVRELAHSASSVPQGANTSSKASSGLGKGLALAKATAASTASRTSRSIWARTAAVATPCSCNLVPKTVIGSCCCAASTASRGLGSVGLPRCSECIRQRCVM